MSVQPCRIWRHVVWHVDTAQEEKRVSFTFRVIGICFYPEKVGSRFSRNADNNLPNRSTSHTHWDPNLVQCLFLARQPPVGQGHEVSRSHTTTHHSRYDSSGRVISSSQRPLPDNTQHSEQTNIHTSSGIRTHSLSRRAAANPRLRQRGHWDWQT